MALLFRTDSDRLVISDRLFPYTLYSWLIGSNEQCTCVVILYRGLVYRVYALECTEQDPSSEHLCKKGDQALCRALLKYHDVYRDVLPMFLYVTVVGEGTAQDDVEGTQADGREHLNGRPTFWRSGPVFLAERDGGGGPVACLRWL